jgi:hypothetical protein
VKLSQKLTKEQVDPFFKEWEEMASQLSELHKRRDANAKHKMEEGILLYKRLRAHCAGAGLESSFGPLNGEERLAFAVSRPGSFAAFRQLDELFSEMKKMVAARRIRLKRMEN